MSNITNTFKKINLPALRGQIGDWYYYVTVLKFEEVAQRVKLPEEIDEYNSEDKKLGEWIQRKIDMNRTKSIVEYLNGQDQRFFNSLILGIYGGSPSWQELSIRMIDNNEIISEDSMDYMEQTFGVLTLNGEESIFAIDGQHRAVGIREAILVNNEIATDEIPVIFVAHKTTQEGLIRTRRLFSTLNRYAKPVNTGEIITLSEDDNCAIITRNIVEKYAKFSDKILLNKSRVISPDNTTHFTNLMALYDFIVILLSDSSIVGIKVKGYKKENLINKRFEDVDIIKMQKDIEAIFNEITEKIPSLSNYFNNLVLIDRKNHDTSLLFRPIGQNILFSVLKVAKENSLLEEAIAFFAKDNFNLNNVFWHKIFWDNESQVLFTDKGKQNYAIKLILEKIGFKISRTKKELEVYQNYNITIEDI